MVKSAALVPVTETAEMVSGMPVGSMPVLVTVKTWLAEAPPLTVPKFLLAGETAMAGSVTSDPEGAEWHRQVRGVGGVATEAHVGLTQPERRRLEGDVHRAARSDEELGREVGRAGASGAAGEVTRVEAGEVDVGDRQWRTATVAERHRLGRGRSPQVPEGTWCWPA